MAPFSKEIWQIEADIKGRSNFDFFTTSDDKYGIYFSNIEEYGMLKFVSPVQVWTDKESPRLLFQSKNIQFEYQNSETCYYLDKSGIIALLTPCSHKNYFDLLYVLLDFGKALFATINAPNFRPTELDVGLIRLDINFRYAYDGQTKNQISKDDGKEVDLTKLHWRDVKQIDNACSYHKNNR
jgi:hypothetical protein